MGEEEEKYWSQKVGDVEYVIRAVPGEFVECKVLDEALRALARIDVVYDQAFVPVFISKRGCVALIDLPGEDADKLWFFNAKALEKLVEEKGVQEAVKAIEKTVANLIAQRLLS